MIIVSRIDYRIKKDTSDRNYYVNVTNTRIKLLSNEKNSMSKLSTNNTFQPTNMIYMNKKNNADTILSNRKNYRMDIDTNNRTTINENNTIMDIDINNISNTNETYNSSKLISSYTYSTNEVIVNNISKLSDIIFSNETNNDSNDKILNG